MNRPLMKAYDPDEISKDYVPEKDEVKTYLNCRYVGPCEAMWRIMKFSLQKMSHSCVRLSTYA
jgi:hypothetical protein